VVIRLAVLSASATGLGGVIALEALGMCRR
jgi:hypothetical protein